MKVWALALTIGLTTPAVAQLLGGGGLAGGRLGNAIGGVTGGVLGAPGSGSGVVGGIDGPLMGVGGTLQSLAPEDLLNLRSERLRALVHDNPATLDVDDQGNPVRRDEILGLGLSAYALAKAKAAGFSITRTETVAGFALTMTVLQPPKDRPVRKAIETLHALDPVGIYALDHLYEPARASLAPIGGPIAGGNALPASSGKIGLIDGGVGRHPALANAQIEQRGFAGDPRPSGHGTAVASLMVGSAGPFRGVAPGTPLLVADVYGGSAANGTALAIVRAMAWLAQSGAKVINISLVGPPNAVLETGVKALMARGILVVAAVGNDGPAAPPQYPASYPGVIAVTGVDARGRALIEAGKPLHLDFAAPGADMVGALPGGGWETLRGTSFAAPLVTASLVRARNIEALAAEAKPGSGKIGRGIVCGECRIPPEVVGLK